MSDATVRRKCLEEEDTPKAPESGKSGAATNTEEKKDVVMEDGEEAEEDKDKGGALKPSQYPLAKRF